jgi:exodeoxyribonuclease V beta subunit
MTATAFEISGALPEGRVTLEASAGTGKTWTIAALVSRYVAEAGVPIERILVVTFTRAATSELRDRVRSRLVEAEAALRASLGGNEVGGDRLLEHLVAGDDEERRVRLGRLQRAVRAFDEATVSTIHGFAGALLRLLGLLSRGPAGVPATGDVASLVEELLSDLSVAEFLADPAARIDLGELRAIAGAVVTNPDADIVPTDGGDPAAERRRRLAEAIRAGIRERTVRAGVLTFDDLLILARDSLRDPDVGEAARAVVREAFDVALVDEFQDTDRIQWDIVSSVFDGHGTLLVIGDPKQAIYAFRGADVTAYLDAASASAATYTLGTNWRADGPLLTALEAMFDGVAFGDPRIVFRPVDPAPGREAATVPGIPAPVAVRILARTMGPTTKSGNLTVDAARKASAADAAAYVVSLLDAGVTVPDGEGGERALRPSDIAVLCRKRSEIALVDQALREAAVPSVVGRTGSVLLTPAAYHWLGLLAALAQPASPARVRRVLLSPFADWTAARLATASDEELAAEHDRIADWALTLRTRGVPALLGRIDRETGLSARILARRGGERLLTDIQHVGEVIHAGTRDGGVRSVEEWLIREIDQAARTPEEAETRVRRLETDAQAVQLLTIHTAKGLEFPVVACPFLWDPRPSFADALPVVTDPARGRRAVFVGGQHAAGWAEAKERSEAEQDEEDFRVLYVAVTRARHHLALWWAPHDRSGASPLAKVLFGRTAADEPPDVVASVLPVTERRMVDKMAPVLQRAGGTIAVEVVDRRPTVPRWSPPQERSPALDRAVFTGAIDRTWWRWSYSRLAASAGDTHDDLTETVKGDEAPEPQPPPPGAALPLGDVPGGARFGTLVHSVLEDLDFTAPDLERRLEEAVAERAARAGLADLDPAVVAAGVVAAVDTPLGAHLGERRLRDLGPGDRLDELTFEAPVRTAGPDPVSVADLAAVLGAHLPDDDPLAAYPARLATLGAGAFRGYLTGAVDLTLRLTGPDGTPRWWVADYKTNRLPARGDEASTADYAHPVLAAEMIGAHYGLQALLYRVALHRYLRLRLPGYDPDTHLGGALYLFVRGMVGPDTPVVDGHRAGVFTWGPHPGLVEAVDALFRGER